MLLIQHHFTRMDDFLRVAGIAQLQYRLFFTAAGIDNCHRTFQRITDIQHLIFFIQRGSKRPAAGFDDFGGGEFLQIEFVDNPAGFVFIKRR